MKKSRNEPCHCGSGKKYKKCCLEEDEKKHLLEHKINTGGFFFDGERLVIPQESMKIFGFLAEIILEIENILSFEKRLKEIGGLMAEYMDCISDCWKKLKENNIDFEYHNFSENPKDIAKKLHFKRSPRSEAIIIFSYIETLRCLWTAYDKKTSDEKDLRDASDSAMDYFLKEFCLCSENKWVKDNPEMSGKFGHKKLRELRNKLVHFYTVTSLGLVNYRCEETNKITKATQNLSQSISPQDLLEIAKGAFLLLLQKWDTDSGSKDFQERMKFVEEVVERDSPYSFDLKSLTEEEK